MKNGFRKLLKRNLSTLLGFKSTELEGEERLVFTKDTQAVRVPASSVYDKEGKLTDSLVVELNQRVKVTGACLFCPKKEYSAVVTVNPALYERGQVDARVIYTHENVQQTPILYFKALKKTDLSKYDWVFEIKLLD